MGITRCLQLIPTRYALSTLRAVRYLYAIIMYSLYNNGRITMVYDPFAIILFLACIFFRNIIIHYTMSCYIILAKFMNNE